MKNLKFLPFVFSSTLLLFSCSNATKENEKIKELEVRLIATESQLLNIKSELAKCSDYQDSLNIGIMNKLKDSSNIN